MAIRLTTCLVVITLVIRFANVELTFGQQQRVHFIAFVAEQLHHVLGYLTLRFVSVEDATTVLRPDVRTYPICLCRVVYFKEEFAEAFVGDNRRVELYNDSFHVMGLVVTHIGIRWERLFTTGITRQRTLHPFLFGKLMLSTPKAATRKDSDLYILIRRCVVKFHF